MAGVEARSADLDRLRARLVGAAGAAGPADRLVELTTGHAALQRRLADMLAELEVHRRLVARLTSDWDVCSRQLTDLRNDVEATETAELPEPAAHPVGLVGSRLRRLSCLSGRLGRLQTAEADALSSAPRCHPEASLAENLVSLQQAARAVDSFQPSWLPAAAAAPETGRREAIRVAEALAAEARRLADRLTGERARLTGQLDCWQRLNETFEAVNAFIDRQEAAWADLLAEWRAQPETVAQAGAETAAGVERVGTSRARLDELLRLEETRVDAVRALGERTRNEGDRLLGAADASMDGPAAQARATQLSGRLHQLVESMRVDVAERQSELAGLRQFEERLGSLEAWLLNEPAPCGEAAATCDAETGQLARRLAEVEARESALQSLGLPVKCAAEAAGQQLLHRLAHSSASRRDGSAANRRLIVSAALEGVERVWAARVDALHADRQRLAACLASLASLDDQVAGAEAWTRDAARRLDAVVRAPADLAVCSSALWGASRLERLEHLLQQVASFAEDRLRCLQSTVAAASSLAGRLDGSPHSDDFVHLAARLACVCDRQADVEARCARLLAAQRTATRRHADFSLRLRRFDRWRRRTQARVNAEFARALARANPRQDRPSLAGLAAGLSAAQLHLRRRLDAASCQAEARFARLRPPAQALLQAMAEALPHQLDVTLAGLLEPATRSRDALASAETTERRRLHHLDVYARRWLDFADAHDACLAWLDAAELRLVETRRLDVATTTALLAQPGNAWPHSITQQLIRCCRTRLHDHQTAHADCLAGQPRLDALLPKATALVQLSPHPKATVLSIADAEAGDEGDCEAAGVGGAVV
ncbi:unnamed protein product, partial [Protopolystoma xenopodis]